MFSKHSESYKQNLIALCDGFTGIHNIIKLIAHSPESKVKNAIDKTKYQMFLFFQNVLYIYIYIYIYITNKHSKTKYSNS